MGVVFFYVNASYSGHDSFNFSYSNFYPKIFLNSYQNWLLILSLSFYTI